ncbi:hypothetical protein MXB_2555, partial [Myxobolus squamalis]
MILFFFGWEFLPFLPYRFSSTIKSTHGQDIMPQRAENDSVDSVSNLVRITTYQHAVLYVHLLRFIYAALTERHFIGQSLNEEYEYMKREYFDKILEEVADMDKMHHYYYEFTLKDEYFREINRFYYHYSMETVSQVHDLLKKRLPINPVVFKPRDIPNLKPQFIGIRDFILSEPFKNFLLHLIKYIWANLDHNFYCSDLLEL